jgi:26S proteasome regulatory subunit N6
LREAFDAMQAIQRLSDVYAQQNDAEALIKLLTELRPLFGVITKAKTAKIIRNVIETIAKVPNSTQLQVCSSPRRA